MDTPVEQRSIQDQIDRINGRISCISDAQRKILGMLEHMVTKAGEPSVLELLTDHLRASIERRPDNQAAVGGYRLELEKIERLIHRPSPSDGDQAEPRETDD